MSRTRLPFQLILIALLLCHEAAFARSFRVIGYVTRSTKIESIDAHLVTHLNYAFAKVRGDDSVFLENPDDAATIARLRALKTINPQLKVILSIGGWGAEWFSDAALTAESRCRFASSAIELMRQNDLDGLDIDWEYPGQQGGNARFRREDKENFTLLLRDLRRELDVLSDGRGLKGAERYTLSIATGGGQYFQFTQMDRVHKSVDWINVMTYDFAAGWSPATGHHAALFGTGPISTQAFVAQHLAAGIPRDKIVVGVPFYGKTWRWVNRKSTTGISEPFDLFSGDISYSDLQLQFLNDPRYQHGWDTAAKAPYLWDPELGTFVSYDDPRSMAEKARFVKQQRLGGVMYWEHNNDPDQSLLTTLYTTLHEK
jgi:chitinase